MSSRQIQNHRDMILSKGETTWEEIQLPTCELRMGSSDTKHTRVVRFEEEQSIDIMNIAFGSRGKRASVGLEILPPPPADNSK